MSARSDRVLMFGAAGLFIVFGVGIGWMLTGRELPFGTERGAPPTVLKEDKALVSTSAENTRIIDRNANHPTTLRGYDTGPKQVGNLIAREGYGQHYLGLGLSIRVMPESGTGPPRPDGMLAGYVLQLANESGKNLAFDVAIVYFDADRNAIHKIGPFEVNARIGGRVQQIEWVEGRTLHDTAGWMVYASEARPRG